VLSFDGSEIARSPLEANLTETYVGITAVSESRVSKINLLSVEFQVSELGEKIGSRTGVAWNPNPASHFSPPESGPMRKPYFNLTLEEYNKRRAANDIVNSEASVDRLFDVIDEVNAASFEVASFSELNAFVNDKLMRYSEKWHRRTIKIVERVQQSRNVSGVAWQYTQSMLQTFNATLKDSVLKASGKIGDLSDLLREQSELGIDEGRGIGHIAEAVTRSRLIGFFVWMSGIEMVALTAFLLTANVPSVRSDLLGLV
jgi:hypothetical protein